MISEPESNKRARALMGQNFLGLPEVIEHFGSLVREDQLSVFASISRAILGACEKRRETHVLVADTGISTASIYRVVGEELFYSSATSPHPGEAAITNETAKPCWRLIRKDAVPESFYKPWETQLKLLSKKEEVPSARSLTYAIILLLLARGEKMLEESVVRTATLADPDRRICVGPFDYTGLQFHDSCWEESSVINVGLASALKS